MKRGLDDMMNESDTSTTSNNNNTGCSGSSNSQSAGKDTTTTTNTGQQSTNQAASSTSPMSNSSTNSSSSSSCLTTSSTSSSSFVSTSSPTSSYSPLQHNHLSQQQQQAQIHSQQLVYPHLPPHIAAALNQQIILSIPPNSVPQGASYYQAANGGGLVAITNNTNASYDGSSGNNNNSSVGANGASISKPASSASNGSASEAKKVKTNKTQPSKVVHIRNIPPQLTEVEVIQFGLIFGNIVNVLNLRSKCQAFLEFDKCEEAQSMVNYFVNNPIQAAGRQIFVQYSNYKNLVTDPANTNNQVARAALDLAKELHKSAQTGGQNTVLRAMIQNMLYPVTLDIIYSTFSKYGHVLKIITFTKNEKFQALIQMKDATSAQAAKAGLHGHHMFQSCCTLHIDYSKLNTLNVKYNNEKSRDYTNPLLPAGDCPEHLALGPGGIINTSAIPFAMTTPGTANMAAALAAASAAGFHLPTLALGPHHPSTAHQANSTSAALQNSATGYHLASVPAGSNPFLITQQQMINSSNLIQQSNGMNLASQLQLISQPHQMLINPHHRPQAYGAANNAAVAAAAAAAASQSQQTQQSQQTTASNAPTAPHNGNNTSGATGNNGQPMFIPILQNFNDDVMHFDIVKTSFDFFYFFKNEDDSVILWIDLLEMKQSGMTVKAKLKEGYIMMYTAS